MVALKVECSVVQKVALKVGHLVVHSVDLMAVHWAVYLVVQKVDLLEHPHNYYYR
jgi:large-conductance mechanosensitive channel